MIFEFSSSCYYLNEYIKPFFKTHSVASKFIAIAFSVFIYFPLSLSITLQAISFENAYHDVAKTNLEIVKYFIKDMSPSFIYFNNGQIFNLSSIQFIFFFFKNSHKYTHTQSYYCYWAQSSDAG